MNNFGDWLFVELIIIGVGLIVIYCYNHKYLKKLIPKILYSTYIWNLPVSIFLMNFINRFFYVVSSLEWRPFYS